MSPCRTLAVLSFVFAAACAPAPDEVGDDGQALVLRHPIDRAAGALVIGASADGRRVVYGTGCEDGVETKLKLWDDVRGRITPLLDGAPCMPGAVTFSPDGALVAYGAGDGVIHVRNLRTGRHAIVSRPDHSGLGVVFSPDSRWLVVASMSQTAGATALDAWDADLSGGAEIAASAYFSPFGPGGDSVRFSPDGARLVYLGQLTPPYPVGALALYDRASGASEVLATGVPAPGWLASPGLERIAWVRGVTASDGAPPAQSLTGDLEVYDVTARTTRSIEPAVNASPVAFTSNGDTLVYLIGGLPGASSTLKAYAARAARPVTLDTDVFSTFGPARSIVVSPRGDEVAYTVAFDPMRFAAALRVAKLPGRAAAAPRTVAQAAVPTAFGWAAGGAALVYLDEPTSSFPGAASGTLRALRATGGAPITLGRDVSQLGLRIDPDRAEVLYLSSYDMQLAAGDLEAWNAYTGARTRLGARAAVMSIQVSQRGRVVGFLSVTPDPTGETPPKTTLQVARPNIFRPAQTVAKDATSLAVSDSGRVIYATPTGLFGAYTF